MGLTGHTRLERQFVFRNCPGIDGVRNLDVRHCFPIGLLKSPDNLRNRIEFSSLAPGNSLTKFNTAFGDTFPPGVGFSVHIVMIIDRPKYSPRGIRNRDEALIQGLAVFLIFPCQMCIGSLECFAQLLFMRPLLLIKRLLVRPFPRQQISIVA